MISLQDIEKLAELSRLELAPEEKESLRKEMDSILGYVEQVSKLTATLEISKKAGIVHNVMRDDINPHESGLHTETLVSASPKRQGNYFKVKKIL